MLNGVAPLTFTNPLDPESATNPEFYAVEWWQYRYTKNYGSPDYSVNDPSKRGRDDVPIKSITLSKDGRTVSLEIPEIRPVMQMGIRLRVKAADGTRIRQEIYNTIHSVPE